MKMNQFQIALLVLLQVIIAKPSYAQTSPFVETSEKIENLLRYKEKSPTQLRSLMVELSKYKLGNESDFALLKSRVDHVLLPIDIKYARSDVYNKKYREAVQKMNVIKENYTYDKNIEKLEDYLDRKLFVSKKRILLKTKPTWFSIEPSIAMYTSEINLKSMTDIRNVNPVYGLGFYVKLNNEEKSSIDGKSTFRFSQLGVKLDYRDPNYTYLKDTTFTSNSPYFNSQLSFLYRKTLGLDAGMMSFSNSPGDFSNLYSFTGSIYIPMNYISVGINARFITDFMSTNPLFQMGATLKFNFGVYKSFNSRDKEEIRSQVIKFKEAK
jgi:hypothetical protein